MSKFSEYMLQMEREYPERIEIKDTKVGFIGEEDLFPQVDYYTDANTNSEVLAFLATLAWGEKLILFASDWSVGSAAREIEYWCERLHIEFERGEIV